ncbi:MAG: urea ABC transporter permease subunit UrtB [Pseudomonadales bacterium]|nr:urea ABC transporter permease subunit UrtB [Pseudomonadales bacterium]
MAESTESPALAETATVEALANDAASSSASLAPNLSGASSNTVSTEVLSPNNAELINRLAANKLSALAATLDAIEGAMGSEAIALFEAIVEGRAYFRKADQQVFIVAKREPLYALFDPITAVWVADAEKSALRKIRSNNKIRKQLRSKLAKLSLIDPSAEVRLLSVKKLLDNADAESITLVKSLLATEPDPDVAELMQLLIALDNIQHSDDVEVQLAALEHMRGSLHPAVRNQLNQLLAIDADGQLLLDNPRLTTKAAAIQASIGHKVQFYAFVEQLFFGLSMGSVLLLVATGLAITFGVMGVINMAHGELIMLGAYTTYVVQMLLPNHLEYSVLIAIPLAFLVSGLVGLLIERGVIRFLHGRPLETLLATFGISLILQQAVRSIFSPLNRQVSTPDWMSGSLVINEVFSLTYNRLYILLFALLVFFMLQLILKKTALGLHVRAVAQNRQMAKSMGIRTEWVDAMTFALGSGIAGIAGVALSQLTNVGPNLGQAYIIDSFMVVVFGGVGNLWGTLLGGFSLGIANKSLEPMTGAVLANILVLVFIILFIQKRPKGLFPQKGRAAD